jgi:CheY-like chemotaxis protein
MEAQMFCEPNITLFVDRDDEVLELLRTAWEPADYVVLQANSGEEALGVLSRIKSHIDLSVIDMELTLEDGTFMNLLATFARRRPTTKTIVKTSRHDEPFLEQLDSLGVDATALKPITKEQFLQTVRATVMSKHPNGSGGKLAGTAA